MHCITVTVHAVQLDWNKQTKGGGGNPQKKPKNKGRGLQICCSKGHRHVLFGQSASPGWNAYLCVQLFHVLATVYYRSIFLFLHNMFHSPVSLFLHFRRENCFFFSNTNIITPKYNLAICPWVWDLTFRHRASCILGQAFHYSPENAFYIFNQQIYFIIWYLLDRASLI